MLPCSTPAVGVPLEPTLGKGACKVSLPLVSFQVLLIVQNLL